MTSEVTPKWKRVVLIKSEVRTQEVKTIPKSDRKSPLKRLTTSNYGATVGVSLIRLASLAALLLCFCSAEEEEAGQWRGRLPQPLQPGHKRKDTSLSLPIPLFLTLTWSRRVGPESVSDLLAFQMSHCVV